MSFQDLWSITYSDDGLTQHRLRVVRVNHTEVFIAFSKYRLSPLLGFYVPTKKQYFIPIRLWNHLHEAIHIVDPVVRIHLDATAAANRGHHRPMELKRERVNPATSQSVPNASVPSITQVPKPIPLACSSEMGPSHSSSGINGGQPKRPRGRPPKSSQSIQSSASLAIPTETQSTVIPPTTGNGYQLRTINSLADAIAPIANPLTSCLITVRTSGCMKRVQPGDEKTMQSAEESAKASKQDESVSESDIFGDDEDDV